jgi:pilus assembly protein CpaC
VPVVLGDGRIRLKMTPEVSDLDFSTPIVISGSRIPVVNKRRVTTMVELADGQTFAIAGLLNNNIAAAKDVTPVLGDLPVLGALFRSVRYQRRETELVVLVTPKLVAPLNPGQVHKLPGENWRHPNEAQLFLNQDIGGEQEIPVERAPDADDNAAPTGGLAPASANSTTAPTNSAVALAPATTQPANGAATTQPALAVRPTTSPALAAAPVTQPSIAATPTTKPAVAISPATQPAVAWTPATQPTVITPAVAIAPATQPSTAPTVVTTTPKPWTPTPVAAPAATQPANPVASNTPNTTPPVKTVATATPSLPAPKSTGSTPVASGRFFTPRYHGRHGFTPPSHAPPRGQQ